jgi:hypothetical protein
MAGSEAPETMTGLAKRWLKTQLTLHGDPIRSIREQQAAAEIEQRMHENARDDATRSTVEALLPPSWKRKLNDWEQQAEDRKAQQEVERRAEHAARPHAALTLSISGDISASFTANVPVILRRPAEEDTALVVELEPLDDISVAGHTFLGLQFAVPDYRGSGDYDLLAMAIAGDAWIETWDTLWFQMWLDTLDESYFWCPDYGQATATVAESTRNITIDMPMQDAGGHVVRVTASLDLPGESTI